MTEPLPLNTPKRSLEHWLAKPGLLEHLLGLRTQAELAAASHVSQPAVNKWLRSLRRNYSVTPEAVRALIPEGDSGGSPEVLVDLVKARLLDGFSKSNAQKIKDYLGSGGGALGPASSGLLHASMAYDGGHPQQPPPPNITDNISGVAIPVLSKVPAGSLTEAVRGDLLGHVLSTSRKASKGCYALRVVGDSMTAPAGSTDSFPEGCTIVIKPCDEASHGQFVVAQNDESGAWTFKKFQSLGLDAPLLIPLNAVGHLPIDMKKARLRVVGTLIEVVFSKTY